MSKMKRPLTTTVKSPTISTLHASMEINRQGLGSNNDVITEAAAEVENPSQVYTSSIIPSAVAISQEMKPQVD